MSDLINERGNALRKKINAAQGVGAEAQMVIAQIAIASVLYEISEKLDRLMPAPVADIPARWLSQCKALLRANISRDPKLDEMIMYVRRDWGVDLLEVDTNDLSVKGRLDTGDVKYEYRAKSKEELYE